MSTLCSAPVIKTVLLTLILTAATIDAQTVRFSCNQDVPPGEACQCYQDKAGVYTSQKDCAVECCPTYNCDPGSGKCMPDLAGGYPFAHCAGSCGSGYSGYQCNPATMQCEKSNTNTFSLEYCETMCGSQGESSVVLCAYTCGAGATQCSYQFCLDNPAGSGAAPTCPGAASVTAGADRPVSSDGTTCCATRMTCPNHNHGWSCCNAADTWDGVLMSCQPGGPPPPPPATQSCPDGSTATWINSFPMSGGLMMCMNYANNWGDQLCGPADCPMPKLKGPVCPPASTLLSMPASSETLANNLNKNKKRPYMGIDELTPPKMNGRQINHTVAWTNEHGHFLNLTYHAVLTDQPIFSIDSEPHVQSVSCDRETVTIELDQHHETITRLRDASFITGGHHWGCFFERTASILGSSFEGSILRRVTAVSGSANRIELVTTKAKYEELFESAHIQFSTNYLPGATKLHADSPNPAHRIIFNQQRDTLNQHRNHQQGRELLGFWSGMCSFFSKAWNAVKSIAEEVAKVVETTAAAVKALVAGEFDYSKSLTLAQIEWNYDESSKGAKQSDIKLSDNAVCSECFLNFGVSLNVALSIESYSLKHVAAYLEGHAQVHLNVTSDVEVGVDPSFDVLLATLVLPKVTFDIGIVPFVIQTTVPVHAGGDLNLASQAGGSVQALAHMDADVKYGVQYTPDDGFQYINTHTLTHSGGLGAHHIELTAVAKVYLMPVIVINIDHIGGPNIGFKGFVQASLDYKEDSSMCSTTGGAGLSFTTAWGLQLTLGAHLNVSFIGHTFLDKTTDNEPIWSHQWPLTAGCLDIAASRQLADKQGFVSTPVRQLTDDTYDFFEGVQYVGDIVIKDDPACDKLVSIHGGLQFVNQSENGYPGWVGISMNNNGRTSSLTDYNIACAGQHYYIADGAQLKHYIQPSLEPDVSYVNCTLKAMGSGVTLADLQGSWGFSADLSTINLTPTNPCILPVALHRETPQTGTLLPRTTNGVPDVVWSGTQSDIDDRRKLVADRFDAARRMPQLSPAEANAVLRGIRKA